MRRAIVAGNWKMNGSLATTTTLLTQLLSDIDSVKQTEVIVFPPFVYLPHVAESLKGSSIAWGAQNVSAEAEGAFTGDVAPGMLADDFHCRYVLIGHSERRQYYHENDVLLAKKFSLAKEFGLTPIFCVGETLSEREQDQTEAVIAEQVAAILALQSNAKAFENAVIAYEPVWAIGTGRTATPEQAQAVHAFIRAQLAAESRDIAENTSILYGGSVKASNAEQLFAMPDIDGGLVGGASLDAQEFISICRAAG